MWLVTILMLTTRATFLRPTLIPILLWEISIGQKGVDNQLSRVCWSLMLILLWETSIGRKEVALGLSEVCWTKTMDMHPWQMQTGDGKNAQMTSKIDTKTSLPDLDLWGSESFFIKSHFLTGKNPHLVTMNIGSTFGPLFSEN